MPLGLHPAEFVPAAPLLPALAEWAAFFFAWGFCVLVAFVVAALFAQVNAAIGWVPWLGGKTQAPLHSIEQKITNKLGEAVAALDHRMALAWYKLAHTAEWIGHEIMANSGVLLAIARTLEGLPGLVDWRAFIRKVKASLVWAEQHAIGAVHTITKPLTANVSALSRWAHAQIRALQNTIAVTIPGEFAGLRKRAKALEDARLRHFDWLKKLEARFSTKAFAGFVVAALAYLGLGWIRCGKLRTRGPALCNLDDGLFESLLADTLLIFGTLSLVEFAREMVGVTDTAVRPITTFWRAN